MYQKRKYKNFILLFLVLDLLAMVFLGYRYLDRKIPDEIHIDRKGGVNLSQLEKLPFMTFGDAVTASGEGSYHLTCRLFGKIPFKEIKVTPTESDSILVSGSTVGIYMETAGVLVIDTGEILSGDGQLQDPAKNILKPGDYIVSLNQQKISCKQDLINDLENIDGSTVTMDVRRDNSTIPVSITPVQDSSGNYKLGVWVRDDTQGIGTLTYVTKDGNFGALGHGISDIDTGNLLSIKGGNLYCAQILGVQKGEKGSPGELSGLIRYRNDNVIGHIRTNNTNGIYGSFIDQIPNNSGNSQTDSSVKASSQKNNNSWDFSHCFSDNTLQQISLRQMKIGYKQEVQTGPASILCNIGNGVKEYSAEITRIDMNHENSNKSFVIHITDQELLDATGGIVQGMSGSPVLQNGKVIGAITHVFVQDATSGYGIFIENMLEIS
ncbi:MAG: SpoIVB peptidase S55 domain-containing protein [Clostridia bacterium]|nr:SpoIVB peptidase S55 domain-containing protein [Clostridia bacterium]